MIDDIIAIDFGSQRTKVAYFNPATQKVELMYLGEDDKPFIPSNAGIDPTNENKILVGEAAVDLLERGVGIVTDALKKSFRYINVTILAKDQGGLKKGLKNLSPKESLTALLTEARARAGKDPAFKGQPSAAVLTHSSEYSHDDREHLRETAADAGFDKDKIELIDEITAAGYLLQAQMPGAALPKDIIVVNLGAGTTDWLYLHLNSQSGRYGRMDFDPGTVSIGGYDIDDFLTDHVEAMAKDIEIDRVYVRNQARLRKEWYCTDRLSWPPIKVHPGDDKGVQLHSDHIREAISKAFVEPHADKLLAYAKTITDRTGRKPTFILTGGGMRLKGLKEVLEPLFEIKQYNRYEYATVLGAMHYVRDQMQGDAQPASATIPRAPGDMVLIPAGEFLMGSDAEEASREQRPVHPVYLDAFYMDVHPVTNKQYKQFLDDDANKAWRKPTRKYDSPLYYSWWKFRKKGAAKEIKKKWIEASFFFNYFYLSGWNGNEFPSGEENFPVTGVSWRAAMAYAAWAGKRLPTEAEWEKAARGDLVQKRYPWGDTLSSDKANFGSEINSTTAVGSYPPNEYGLYDMCGNVLEWCLDKYDPNFYKHSPRENPISGVNIAHIVSNYISLDDSRVLRGGSWNNTASYVRCARRYDYAPTTTGNFGFRCVRETVTP